MTAEGPSVIVLGGPNGAGKTTVSEATLSEMFGITEFVNADTIARGLSAFDPEGSAIEAGRIMLQRLHHLGEQQKSFAFESTLSSRTFAPWLKKLIADGYQFHIVYVWLNSPELAIRRVRARKAKGGHFIPEDIVRRRYQRSCANLVQLYMPMAKSWRVIDNSGSSAVFVAYQSPTGTRVIVRPEAWRTIHDVAQAKTEDLE